MSRAPSNPSLLAVRSLREQNNELGGGCFSRALLRGTSTEPGTWLQWDWNS